MRASKTIGLGLALLVLTQTISACTVLRTPYEKAKINENGGTVEAPEDKEGGGGKDKSGGGKGGGKQEKADPGKFKVQSDRAETYNQKRARVKQGGALFQSPYTQDTEREKAKVEQKEKAKKQGTSTKATEQSTQPAKQTGVRMTYNKGLSSQVSKVEDVDSGIVLLDSEHNAYVAILSDMKQSAIEGVSTQVNKALNIKAQGQVPADVQRKIAERLRAADSEIGTVCITNDPSHIKTFQRYASASRTGDLSELNAEALTEHIEDIWKK